MKTFLKQRKTRICRQKGYKMFQERQNQNIRLETEY